MVSGLRTLRVVCGMVALLCISLQTSGAGFDSSYNVFQGDLNGDSRTDLYLKSSRVTVIPLDDIPIVIGPAVRDFVLQNRGDGGFDLIAPLTPAQRSAVATWPSANVGMSVRDIDMDSHPDLDLQSVVQVIPRARDQIVLSSPTHGASPRQVIAKTTQFQSFHNDLLAAIQDPSYFDNNAPNRVVSQEPPSRIYYGTVRSAGDFASTSLLMSWCTADVPSNRQCNLSMVDPSQCMQPGSLYDDAGRYLGSGTRNVCNDFIHVFVYIPGSVTLAKDYSVFDQRARESKEILDRLQNGCALFTPSADTQRINEILNDVYNAALYVPDHFAQNSVPHPPAPGDELFDRGDPTFHHYDVRNKVCDVGQPACNVVNASSFSYKGLRAFSFPSENLVATHTPVDGVTEVMAYVSLPGRTHRPDAYDWPIGLVTQRWVQTGYWTEGIQNVTTPTHGVYPGTIVRKIFPEGNSLYVRTHGIGVNRLFCVSSPLPIPQVQALVYGARMIAAGMNDYWGAKAFHTLDTVMVKEFRIQNGYPTSGPQGVPPGTPAAPEDLVGPNITRIGGSSTQ